MLEFSHKDLKIPVIKMLPVAVMSIPETNEKIGHLSTEIEDIKKTKWKFYN